MTNESKFNNAARFEIEGTFDINASAAVLTLTNKDGTTKTVRGQNMSVAKTGTGQYDVTLKLASSLDGAPIFQVVELLDGHAHLIATAVATALSARVASVTTDSNGNVVVRVITAQTTGAAADSTAAVTVGFRAVIATQRIDGVL